MLKTRNIISSGGKKNITEGNGVKRCVKCVCIPVKSKDKEDNTFVTCTWCTTKTEYFFIKPKVCPKCGSKFEYRKCRS